MNKQFFSNLKIQLFFSAKEKDIVFFCVFLFKMLIRKKDWNFIGKYKEL